MGGVCIILLSALDFIEFQKTMIIAKQLFALTTCATFIGILVNIEPSLAFKSSLRIKNEKDDLVTVDVRGTVQTISGELDLGSIYPFPVVIAPGDESHIRFNIPDYLTDLHYIIDDPGVISETAFGFVGGSSGSFFLENYINSSLSNLAIINSNEFLAPLLFSSGRSTNLFIGIDLNQWIPSLTQFQAGDSFNFVNGISSSLPGVIVGTTPVSFSSSVGWFTANPYTGSGFVIAASDGDTIPEPSSTLGFLALGTLGAASTLKRQLKPSKSTEKETTKIG